MTEGEPAPARTEAWDATTRSGSGKNAGVARKRSVKTPPSESVVQLAIREIDLDSIDVTNTGFQYRLSASHGDLKFSLDRDGQKEPIDVTSGTPHRIIDGFRRVAALRELGRTTVFAILHDIPDEEAHKLAFIKNVVRKNLSPMEKANAIRLARARGNPTESIAKALGLSKRQLKRYEHLVEFPEVVVRALESGSITMAHAMVLSGDVVSDPAQWLRAVEEEGLSASQLKSRIRGEACIRSGRKNVYLRSGDTAIHGYKFALTKDSPAAERMRARRLLERAVDVLQEWERREHKD